MPIRPNPVNWFEIPVSDLDRAKAFYEAVLGVELSLNEMGPAKLAMLPMEMGAAGAAGTLIQGPGYTPSKDGALIYITVPSIDAGLGKITAAGGDVLVPKTDIGPHGFMAHFTDSEGNRVALHEARAAG